MEDSALDVLEQKHRKEKKEVQAQVQALKKAAKNDKTRKKELLIEIARMESELEDKHKRELESIHDETYVNEPCAVEPQSVTENTITKLSKAQKRRDKKLLQDKEREQQIKLQEKENQNGPRNLEIQAICTRLKSRNLDIYSIPSDGDCLYKAVIHQLQVKQNKVFTVENIRNSIASCIENNKEEFMPFLCNPDTYEMLTDEEFSEYCDKIRNTKVWGGQVEIRALSICLKCPITVIQATGPEAIDQGAEFTEQPLIITYHRHMYSLGEHYNSTQPLIHHE